MHCVTYRELQRTALNLEQRTRVVERVKRARGQVKSARARLLRVSSMLFFFSLRQTRFFVHVPFSCSRGMRMCSIVIEFAAEERSVDEGEPGDCAVLYSPLAQLRVCIIEIELIYNDSGLKGAGGKKRERIANPRFFFVLPRSLVRAAYPGEQRWGISSGRW